ncbi:MAG: tRNA (adenosine(37)-N6)-threonylcarbamoyltransferase complex ATPase subunit type 1 TsaE [Sedimentisphaerales bacterium]|nr:tRNA (adenosine(37)-N6)-threonylcarbamoyltransferase complex ATPase subunit type 1 TsaE [Sedimentisphaerales bacterium]
MEIISRKVEQTIEIGQAIGEAVGGGEVIALIGELGTGKTHLIKGMAKGIATGQDDEVTSPTFTLINEYEGRVKLIHIDAYRLENARQLEALGFDEFCEADNVVVIEWADRVWELAAEFEPIEIHLEHAGPTERKIRLDNLPQAMAEKLMCFN